jgi:hypothetical protein
MVAQRSSAAKLALTKAISVTIRNQSTERSGFLRIDAREFLTKSFLRRSFRMHPLSLYRGGEGWNQADDIAAFLVLRPWKGLLMRRTPRFKHAY